MLKKLLHNKSLGLQFFMLGRFAGTLIVSIFLAKSAYWLSSPLSVADIGQYELFLFIAGLISFFWINALIKGILGFANTSNKEIINTQAAQIFYIFLTLSLLTGGIFLLFDKLLSALNSYFYITLCAVFYAILWTTSIILEYLFILRNEPISIFFSGFTTFLLLIIFGIGGTLVTQSVQGTIAGTILFAAIRFIATAIVIFKKKTYKPDWQWIKKFILFSLPLVLATLISESGIYVDGLIVGSLFDDASFAIFRYGARELPFNTLMAIGLSNAMIPLFSSAPKPLEHLKDLKNKTRQLFITLVPISALFLIFSDWLFATVFNKAFVESAIIFDIYLLLVIPRLLVPQSIIIGFKQNNLLVRIAIIEITTHIVLSVCFGLILGITGIAIATLIANIAEKCCMIYLTKKHIGIKFSDYVPHCLFLTMTILIFGIFTLKYTI